MIGVAGVDGVFLLSVTDRIAQASVPVIPECNRWLVQDRTPKFPTIFQKGRAGIAARTLLCCAQIM